VGFPARNRRAARINDDAAPRYLLFHRASFLSPEEETKNSQNQNPNGTPIASLAVEATSNRSDDFARAFLADDETLLAEEGDDEIPFCAFFRLRTSCPRP